MTNKSNHSTESLPTKKTKALSIISYVLLTLAIVFCAVIVFQILTQGYVSIFGYSMFRVVTPSMEPEIPTGALIISQKVNIEDIENGDVICFSSLESYMKGSIVTHRVVDIKSLNGKINLVTRGDANNSVDSYYVTEDNLIGKIVLSTKKDNFFVNAYEFITQKHAFFLIVILPMLAVAIILIRRGIANLNEEIRKIKEDIAQQEAEDASSDSGTDGMNGMDDDSPR